MLALVMTAVLIACARPLMGFFSTDTGIVDLGTGILRCAAAEHRMRNGGARDHLHVPIRRQGPGRTATVRQPSGRGCSPSPCSPAADSPDITGSLPRRPSPTCSPPAVLAVVLAVILLPELRGRKAESRKIAFVDE